MRCVAALALAVGIASAAPAGATQGAIASLPDAAPHCLEAAAVQARARNRPFDELLENDPAQALAVACAGSRQADAGFDALLMLARALASYSRAEQALGLMTALEPAAATQPLGTARLALARAALARDGSSNAEASAQTERAWSALARHGTVPAALHAEALLSRASAARALNVPRALELAAAAADEAERRLRAAGLAESYPMTWVYNERTLQAYARDDLEGALRWAGRERALVRRLSGPDAPAQLHALATLMAVNSTLRRYDVSMRYGREGQRIGRLAPAASRPAYMGILNSLATQLVELGRPLEALAVADDAVALATADWGADGAPLLTPLERRAGALEVLQRHGEVRRTYARMLDILRQQGAGVPVVRRLRVLDTVAGYRLRTGDVDGAQQLADQALALTPVDGALGYWRGRVLRRAAFIAAAQQRWAEADALVQQALPLLEGVLGAGNPYTTALWAWRCEQQLQGRLEPQACVQVAARTASLADASPSHRAATLLALARHAAHLGDTGAAREHLLPALAAAQSSASPLLLWTALDLLAQQLRQAGQPALAVLLGKQAAERMEAVRRQALRPTELPMPWQGERLAVLRRLADWLVEDGRTDEALRVLRLLKADESRAYAAAGGTAPAEAAPPSLPWSEADRRWLRRSPLGDAVAAPAGTRGGAAVQDATRRQTRELEAATVAAWQRALAVPVDAPLAAPGSGAPHAAAPRLPPAGRRDLHATVFMGPAHVNHVLRSHAGLRVVRSPADVAELRRDIGRLLARMARREDTQALQAALYRRLAAPIAEEAGRAGATRVLLQLDGDLRYVPFAALLDGGSPLVERLALQQVVAGTAGAAPAIAAAAPAWVQAFAGTRAAAGMPALPGAADEVCAIVDGPVDGADDRAGCGSRGAVPGRGWLDAAFHTQSLRTAAATAPAGRRSLLHIGTHFVLNAGDVGRSWMLLGDGTQLQLDALLDWRFAAHELVTLSACQTGLGGGGEVEGLASLVLQGGARAVLATLWPVDDRSTAAFMRDFYRRLQGGAEPAEALRGAQLQALSGTRGASAHPFHWAGFFLSTREP